ncbi:MAG: tRNA pseudouridine(38-40) synthase TruA [Erysipelotrichaceae bacterium]|nr:tRNA pseudouridine(38-40) synthase TruA [Erysipelotrichaceae bacterium]
MKRRFKCIVSYDGYDYSGWQTQPNKVTVQKTIENTIEYISRARTGITGSGRTDAKVHAAGQVFHFDTEFYLDARGWKRALNGHLPNDIRVLSVEEVDQEFHARFSAEAKRYDYLISLKDQEPDVFHWRYAYPATWHLDIEKMKECSKLFVGRHDFTSFCANSLETDPDQTREIYRIDFHEEGNLVRISYYGEGFLRYMVRMLTGTMLEVGRGRITLEDVQKIMDRRDKTACRYNAKPHGLSLVKVYYDEEEVRKLTEKN